MHVSNVETDKFKTEINHFKTFLVDRRGTETVTVQYICSLYNFSVNDRVRWLYLTHYLLLQAL